MTLLPMKATAALDRRTGEPFFWRGWSDAVRCMDGYTYHLRVSSGATYIFAGRPIADVCGRLRPPFKLLPRYVDLSLYQSDGGDFVAHRKWVSEAHGEAPVYYDVIARSDLAGLLDALLNYDATERAVTLWAEDDPQYARRSQRARSWLQQAYAERVELLCRLGAGRV